MEVRILHTGILGIGLDGKLGTANATHMFTTICFRSMEAFVYKLLTATNSEVALAVCESGIDSLEPPICIYGPLSRAELH